MNVFMFSGGRSSGMALHLVREKIDLVIFNNTGKEREETLRFVQSVSEKWGIEIVWIEYYNDMNGGGHSYKVVDFETASRNGEPFRNIIERKEMFLPNTKVRYCTEFLKIRPTKAYLKDLGLTDYERFLGIRYDEPERYHRLKNEAKMPLYDARITKKQVRDFWQKQPFDLGLKDYQGNCDLCFLKGRRKKMTILSENPKIAEWWAKQEFEAQATFDKEISVLDMLERSKRPFQKALDATELGVLELDLFHCFCGD